MGNYFKKVWDKARTGFGILEGKEAQSSQVPAWLQFPEIKKTAFREATNLELWKQRFAQPIQASQEALELARNLAMGEEGNRAYSIAARRWREQFLPSLAARGLLTSGPGIDIEAEKLGEMAIEQQVQGTQLMQQAAAGLAALKSMPYELQQRVLQFIMSGQVSQATGGEKSTFEKLFPGGLSDMSKLSTGGLPISLPFPLV